MLQQLADANNRIVDSISHLSAATQEVAASSAEAESLSNDNLENAGSAKKHITEIMTVSAKLDKYTAH